MILKYIVKKEDKNIRDILKTDLHISNKLIVKLKNHIFINDIQSKIYCPIKENDVITFDLSYYEEENNVVENSQINIENHILYEDEWILAIDKLPGINVHPVMHHFTDTLANGVKYYFNKHDIHKKIRPVNRLDINTSGVVIFAKCEYIQESLIQQMKNNIFEKIYIAIVKGSLEGQGKIDKPISRKSNSIIEREINYNGAKSITNYESIVNFKIENTNYTLLKCILETGRTHQIRVHLSSIGFPIIGDTLYGVKSNLINRQALHAYNVRFIHPVTLEKIEITSKIPDDMNSILNNISNLH